MFNTSRWLTIIKAVLESANSVQESAYFCSKSSADPEEKRYVGISLYCSYLHLLPTGSEDRGVLGFGSIPVAILPNKHYCVIIA